jgi:hypothetical protein
MPQVQYQVMMAVETSRHSGVFAEVLALEVRDYGGNVLWSGAVEHFARGISYRLLTRLVATRIGRESDCISDCLADYADLS